LPRHFDASEEAFQWPPEERAAGVRSFRVLSNGQLEAAESPSGPIPVVAQRKAEPQKSLRRKASGQTLLGSHHAGRRIADASMLGRRASVWVRTRLSGVASLAILLTALLEGGYILRVLSTRPAVRHLASSQTPDATALKPNPESSERATVPVPVAPITRPKAQKRTGGPGWIVITSPLDLDVFEGDVLLGSTKSQRVMLSPGPHTLRLRNDATGYEGTQRLRITSGRGTRVRIKLPMSQVHVNALPWAEVWIDGRAVGETPIGNLTLPIGPHEVEFRHPTLGQKTLSTVVKAGVLTRLSTDMR
jgi:hypothetical protein